MPEPVEVPAAAAAEVVAPSAAEAPPAEAVEAANDNAAPAKDKAKSNGKAAPVPEPEAPAAPVDEIATLRQLAEKHGFEVDGRTLTIKDKAAFRKRTKEIREGLDAELQARREAFEAEIAPKRADIEKSEAIRKAHAVGDYEGIARALGHKDWNELQEDVIARLADPNYKRLQELERKQQERDAREAREAEDREHRATAAERQRAITAYKADLSERMAKSPDKLVRAMADDPGFITAIHRIQEEHWDGATTISAEKAARMAIKGTSLPLHDELQGLYKRLKSAFEEETEAANDNATPPAETEKSPMKSPKPKTSPAPKPAAAPPGKWESDAEWREYAVRRMKEAARVADEEEGRERRSKKT